MSIPIDRLTPLLFLRDPEDLAVKQAEGVAWCLELLASPDIAGLVEGEGEGNGG